MVGTPATPLSKIRRIPSSTPGGPKVREEKILVTVRMRPLSRKEQAMYDLIAWDCIDEQKIVFMDPNHERPSTPYIFGIPSTECLTSPRLSARTGLKNSFGSIKLTLLQLVNGSDFENVVIYFSVR